MNQQATGRFIAQKRRELNLTQEQLAERLNVSNKTISKWENGKCLPDYRVVEELCKELGVTVSELMDGEVAAEGSIRAYDDAQVVELLRQVQDMQRQKQTIYGVVLIVMGIALNALSGTVGGTDVRDFISGLLLGFAVAIMLGGIAIVGKSVIKR